MLTTLAYSLKVVLIQMHLLPFDGAKTWGYWKFKTKRDSKPNECWEFSKWFDRPKREWKHMD